MQAREAPPMPDRCPICGGSNDCGAVKSNQPADCWCFHTKIPRQLLERIPPSERGKRCVCRSCAESSYMSREE
ncbi:cysteine-rich CWC family protein [Paenibacillus soyae]|uniref:cysteine-rich CWC family protein n=1 Tax=Paenibacillus soyae TaxID=2969249 RepID=UPI00352FF006